MYEKIVNEFNVYVKKTILNAVKNFAREEQTRSKNEISLDMIADKTDNKETALLPFRDDYDVFSFEKKIKN